MKKLFVFTVVFFAITSCTTTKEAKSSRIELKKEKKLAEQEAVKRSVESRRFIVKLERLYSPGGTIDLLPRKNFIIVDGQRAIISAAYLGRQYYIRPVAGIKISGEALNYSMEGDSEKGTFKIRLKVNNNVNSVNIFLAIDKSGKCNASLSNLTIDNVHYKGFIVPIKEKTSGTTLDSVLI